MGKKITIEIIKERIKNHLDNGGSIYDPRRQLPYYPNLASLVKKMKDAGKKDACITDAYALCGYDFDREYAEYLKLIETLNEFADENNFVDDIKKTKGSKSAKTLIKKMATTVGCSPSDYLILMTDFRYKKNIISTDYISQLRKELFEAYPNGNIANIKRENPTLYEKLRHVCKYSPEAGINDMQSISAYFGLYNDRFSEESIYSHLEEKKIIKQLNEFFPDRNLDNLHKFFPNLYFKTIKCAASHNMTLKQWCDANHLCFTSYQDTDRLSKTIVDSKKRETELFAIRDKFINHKKIFQNPKEEYYYRKDIAIKVIKYIDQSLKK